MMTPRTRLPVWHNDAVLMEVIPGHGLVVAGARLTFGMDPNDVQAALTAHDVPGVGGQRWCGAPYSTDLPTLPLRHDAWLRGLGADDAWSLCLRLDGTTVTFDGGGPEHRRELSRITLTHEHTATDVVAWDGIDLWQESVDEIVTCLDSPIWPRSTSGPDTVDYLAATLRLTSTQDVARELTLVDEAFGSWSACCTGQWECARGGDVMGWIVGR